MRGISVISKEAILYLETLILSRKSTPSISKGELKKSRPKFSAIILSLGCHSYGIAASENKSQGVYPFQSPFSLGAKYPVERSTVKLFGLYVCTFTASAPL